MKRVSYLSAYFKTSELSSVSEDYKRCNLSSRMISNDRNREVQP